MATYTADNFFNWFFELIKSINLFDIGTNYLVVIGIVLISALMISPRKLSNIKVLALPLMLGYSVVGLHVPLLFMVLGGVVFAMEILTTKGVGEVIESVSQKVSELRGLPAEFRERRTSKREKTISDAKRERGILEAERSGLIPFRKGTTISDVLDESERKKILKLKSKTKRDNALDNYFRRMKEKKKYWEVDE